MTTIANGLTRRGAIAAAVAGIAAPALIGGSRQAAAAAPMLGEASPAFLRFKLGGFEVTTISDGSRLVDGPHPIFGENQSAEDVQALMAANLLPETKAKFYFTPVVVNTGAELVLFDTGNGGGGRPAVGNLRARLGAAGYAPEQIDVVVISHFHPDHIGGLMEDSAPAFPNARYVTGRVEYDFWSPEDKATGPTEGVGKLVQANVVPLADKTSFLEGGGEVVSGITAIEAFGHTPGHMAFHIESEGRRLLLWADTTNHFVASLQRPDWHVRFDMDKQAAAATRHRILDMAAAERMPATGYHMPFPSLGFVEKSDAGYRWVAASYQLDV